MELTIPLSAVLRTTKDHLEVLRDMGITTVGDLLNYLPRSHQDRGTMHTLATAAVGQSVTIAGSIHGLKLARIRGGRQIVNAKFTDTEGQSVDVTWFNQPHVMRMLQEGQDVVFTGKLAIRGRKLVFQSPQFEVKTSRPLIHAGRLVPIYPSHDIITTKWLREKMVLLQPAVEMVAKTLPEEVVRDEGLLPMRDAIRILHFPTSSDDVAKAFDRLAFDRMYRLQEEALERRRSWQASVQARLKTPMDVPLVRALFASLHFTPTESQRIAMYEILRDMERDVPMSRLLEGDVGSGKTLVAVGVIANVLRHGGQCALMVPTEVLARQHAASATKLLLGLHRHLMEHPTKETSFPVPNVVLLTGSTPRRDADAIKGRIAAGTVDLAIGTHALIEDDVRSRDLRLVIVDEQHRFGVEQRARLKEKGCPHFLSMTATPIPRTLALTAYGDHDLSVLLEKPGQRRPIHTKVVAPRDRPTVERFIDLEIDRGRQVFVICPLISESDELEEVRSVEREAERLRTSFPRRRIALLHGKLVPQEKEAIMRNFRDRNSDMLVSTSVIEVGIDVPNATIIVIEGAERFGLAQLHQLRGRVGRGSEQSHCFLFATFSRQENSPRLKAMEQYDSGFLLAEMDLKLRGPGEIYGLRQSGIPDEALSGLLNPELVQRARRAAERMVLGEHRLSSANVI